jgi:hypothetical protein
MSVQAWQRLGDRIQGAIAYANTKDERYLHDFLEVKKLASSYVAGGGGEEGFGRTMDLLESTGRLKPEDRPVYGEIKGRQDFQEKLAYVKQNLPEEYYAASRRGVKDAEIVQDIPALAKIQQDKEIAQSVENMLRASDVNLFGRTMTSQQRRNLATPEGVYTNDVPSMEQARQDNLIKYGEAVTRSEWKMEKEWQDKWFPKQFTELRQLLEWKEGQGRTKNLRSQMVAKRMGASDVSPGALIEREQIGYGPEMPGYVRWLKEDLLANYRRFRDPKLNDSMLGHPDEKVRLQWEETLNQEVARNAFVYGLLTPLLAQRLIRYEMSNGASPQEGMGEWTKITTEGNKDIFRKALQTITGQTGELDVQPATPGAGGEGDNVPGGPLAGKTQDELRNERSGRGAVPRPGAAIPILPGNPPQKHMLFPLDAKPSSIGLQDDFKYDDIVIPKPVRWAGDGKMYNFTIKWTGKNYEVVDFVPVEGPMQEGGGF